MKPPDAPKGALAYNKYPEVVTPGVTSDNED